MATVVLRNPSRLLLPVIYLAFISIGLPDGTFGIAWPRMHRDLVLPVELAGTMLILVTLLSAGSSLLSGHALRRFGTGPVVFVSCLLTAIAQVIVARAQGLGGLIAAAIPLGIGAGAVDAGLNGYVARHYSARHMNWLHASWGLGATGGPLIVTALLATSTGWRGGYAAIGGVQFLLALLFLATLRLWDRKDAPPGQPTDRATSEGGFGWASANSGAGWMSTAAFGLYVAAETTLGLWAGSVLVVARGLPQSAAGWSVAAYFGSITLGRILLGFGVDRFGNRGVIQAGLATALVGAVLFTVARNGSLSFVALGLCGLGLAPVYPGLMHETPKRFTAVDTPVVIGRQAAAAYLGSAILSPGVGALARLTSLEVTGWVVMVGVVGLIALIRVLDRATKPNPLNRSTG
jgi:MFS family permease